LELIPKGWTDRLQNKVACMFENQETKYITHLSNGASYDRYIRYMVEKNDFENIIKVEFEGIKFPVPENYHKILKKIYKDYNKLPPKKERNPHHKIIHIDLGDDLDAVI
jgi:lipopolysaccharide cholinephosphotransferase